MPSHKLFQYQAVYSSLGVAVYSSLGVAVYSSNDIPLIILLGGCWLIRLSSVFRKVPKRMIFVKKKGMKNRFFMDNFA